MIYFTPDELRCHCGECKSTGNEMDHIFMERLISLREDADFPFIISSAYRCPIYNAKIAHTGICGPHTTGKAVDIKINELQAYELLRLACIHAFTGIGISQKDSLDSRFIHLDMLDAPEYPRPRVWSY
jgi:zinc D-Ala-D-Ala carboxypeptidase